MIRRTLVVVALTAVVSLAGVGGVVALPAAARAASPSTLSWSNVTQAPTNPQSTTGDTVYDPATAQLLLVQELESGSEYGTQTWVWTGSQWSPQALLPSPNLAPTFGTSVNVAYDTATSQLVLFDDGTYVWTGTVWNEMTTDYPQSNLGYYSTAPMAYDAASGQLILVTGDPDSEDTPVIPTATWNWNGSAWVELDPATSPPPRFSGAIAYDPATSTVVLFGGFGATSYLDDTWTWDGTDWSLATTSTSPPARSGALMAYDEATSQFLLYGGEGATGGGGNQALQDTWTFDGTNWTDESPATTPDTGISLSDDLATNQLVLLAYGVDNQGSYSETWTWDGANWDNATPALGSPPAGVSLEMAYDTSTSQLIAVAGGATFEWEAGAWSELEPTNEPPGWGELAYDTSTGQLIWYQENTYPTAADATWSWDGANWDQVSATSYPAELNGEGSLAFDDSSNQLVLVGPFTDGATTDEETWIFDGTNWTQLAPATSPPATSGAAMAYDPDTAGLVMFGGAPDTEDAEAFSSTWAFDGTTWTELAPATSPPGLIDSVMSYDSATSDLVLFGGGAGAFESEQPTNATWTFDGTNWTELALPANPSNRTDAGLAWDPATSQMLLAGGIAYGESLADTWQLETATEPVPDITSITVGSAFLNLTWTAPDLGPGVVITGYLLTAEPGGEIRVNDSDATSGGVGGLTDGVSYTVTVTPVSAGGSYPASAPSPAAVPLGPPNAPNSLTNTAGDGSILFSWSAPGNTPAAGPVTGYQISYRALETGSSWQEIDVGPDLTSYDVTGLTNGTLYQCQLESIGSFGYGYTVAYQPYATPYSSVGTPPDVAAILNGDTVTVSWTAAQEEKDGPVTGYQVFGPNGLVKTAAPGATTAIFSDVTDPQLKVFQVSALTENGPGPPSAKIAARPAVVPGTPQHLRAVAAVHSARLTWQPPRSDGGDRVTSYVLTVMLCAAEPGPCDSKTVETRNFSSTTTSATIAALRADRIYEFTIAAKSKAGEGVASAVARATPKS
jgi:hypothetical protein